MTVSCQIHDLLIRRGEFRLELPTWSIDAGSVWGLVGHNGAGKTTLLQAMAGLFPIDGGEIRTFGLDPFRHPERVRTQLGYMSDTMPVFAATIGRLFEIVSGYYPRWDESFVRELVDRFELDPGRKVHALSKGEATKLRLVLAMAFRPRLLLLDEPATGLDLRARRTLFATILDYMRDAESSVIISSHDLADLERCADAILVLEGGKVRALGATDTLVGESRTLERAALEWGSQS